MCNLLVSASIPCALQWIMWIIIMHRLLLYMKLQKINLHTTNRFEDTLQKGDLLWSGVNLKQPDALVTVNTVIEAKLTNTGELLLQDRNT